MKNLISTLALFVLLICSFQAVSALNVSTNTIDKIIVPDFGKSAEFEIDVSNATGGEYSIYTLSDVEIFPQKINLKQDSNVFEVEVQARKPASVNGAYAFSYNLKKNANETYTGKMSVKVLSISDLLEISSDVIDSKKGEIKFYIRNKENISVENINVRFSSLLFDEQRKFSLNPSEKKYFVFNVNDDELAKTKAGVYVINADFGNVDGEIVNVKGKMHIGETKEISTQEDSSGLIIHTTTITKINTGNVDELVQINIEKNILTRLFTSFNIEPTSIFRDGLKVEYSWTEELGPAEILSIKAKSNYIFPLLVILLAVAVIYVVKNYTTQKIEVKKSVHHIKTKGGEFALRVKISLKARRDLENVSLIDSVPPIVKVYKNFGTTQPDKIDSASRRLRWNIGNLATGEERVFSYVVYSKVGVVGKFSLPEALVVYEKDEKIHETQSNKVFFLSEQTERIE